MVLGIPVLQLVFWQWWLIELVELSTSLVLILVEPGMLVFLPSLSFLAYRLSCFVLLHHFLVVKDCVSLYGKTSSRRAFNAGVPRVQFLDQLSSFGTSTIFLIVFCVKLLFKLVILLSNQNVTDLLNIRRRLRWNLNKNWILIRQCSEIKSS